VQHDQPEKWLSSRRFAREFEWESAMTCRRALAKDPVSRRPLVGAFAPVGRTGLVVVGGNARESHSRSHHPHARPSTDLPGLSVLIGILRFGGLLASLRIRNQVPDFGAEDG
jgi:hypothetical protein